MVLHTGYLHFRSNGKTQIYDSLKTSLSWVNRKCVHALCKRWAKKFIVNFLLVQKQTHECNCSSFAIAFAAESLDEKSSMKECEGT